MSEGGLPAGWHLVLDPATRRVDGGRVLVGGTPLRVIRLTVAGARWLDRMLDGEPLAATAAERALARRLTDAGVAVPIPAAGASLNRCDVAVVIPARDSPDGVRRTIAALGSVGEIIVVDDGSLDHLALVDAATGATVLRHDRSLGPGAARQRGWRVTSKPVVAFVDADVEPDGDWLTPLLAHFDDLTVAAVAPRIRSRPGSGPPVLDRFEAVRSPLDLGRAAGPVRPGGRVPYVPTALLVVRRAALESVGGFDTELRVGEDVDLVWRLHGGGWRVRYEPGVVAWHPCRPAARSWIRQRVAYGTSAAALARRHGVAVSPLAMSGWSALMWSAALVGRPAVALGVGTGATLALAPRLGGLERPVEALRMAGTAQLRSGWFVADALRRPWWPLAIVVGLASRRARPVLVAAFTVPPLLEWRERRPVLGPLRYVALRLAEDMAYGVGVWVGCLRDRSLLALRPAFTGRMPVSASRRWRRRSRGELRDRVRPG